MKEAGEVGLGHMQDFWLSIINCLRDTKPSVCIVFFNQGSPWSKAQINSEGIKAVGLVNVEVEGYSGGTVGVRG